MDRIWLFRCITQHQREVVTQLWEWRVEAPDGSAKTSRGTFHTLPACVHDAQQSGFLGNVDPATGTFSAKHYEMKVGDYGDIIFKPRAGRPE